MQEDAESRLGAIVAGGIMIAMGMLIMIVWLTVLEVRGSAPAAVRHTPRPLPHLTLCLQEMLPFQ